MLSDGDLMRVQDTTKAIFRPVTLIVSAARSDDPFEKNLVNVARQIAGVSMDRVRIEETDEVVRAGMPSITLSAGSARNIHYQAVPEGIELEPFLDAISWLGGAKPFPPSHSLVSLDELALPGDILVFIAPVCPHCPRTVRTILSLAARHPLVGATIVDAVQFQDLAERYKVRSTPTVIVNDGATLVGEVREETIVEYLVRSGDAGALPAVLGSMIGAGRAEDAAELVCRNKQPQALLPLYLSPEFSVRMGALVVMEEALEMDARSLDPIVEELIRLLDHEDAPLRGDTAAILGKIGDAKAVPALRKTAQDPHPDVREAAEEALALLQL